MSTKIAKSRLGDMKFPRNDGPVNSDVKTYVLPPEELERYRAMDHSVEKKPVGLRITRTEDQEQKRQQATEAAAQRAVKLEEMRVKEMSEKKELTKETYLQKKEEGKTDKQIFEEYGLNGPKFYDLKKKWGLTQRVNTEERKAEPEPDPPASQTGAYELLGQEIGKLVDKKNHAYGDAFSKCGEFLMLLYPTGIQPEQYADALCQVRIFDKQMRIANQKNAFGESPYQDIAGYGLLGTMKDRK